MLLDVPDQIVLEAAHPEEVVLLLDPVDRAPAVRAGPARAEVLLGPVPLLVDAVPPAVGIVVDVSPAIQAVEEGLYDALVPGLRRPDEAVVVDVHLPPRALEARGHPVAECLGFDGASRRLLLDLLTELVRPGEEEDPGTGLPVVAGERIREEGGVRVADVGFPGGVVDRGRDVAFLVAQGSAPGVGLLPSARVPVGRPGAAA